MQESDAEDDTIPGHVDRLGTVGDYDPEIILGGVLHTYGSSLDQPLSSIRMAFAGWQPFAAIPPWDANGRAPFIVFPNSSRQHCENTVCLTAQVCSAGRRTGRSTTDS